jgi:hypothetical protein
MTYEELQKVVEEMAVNSNDNFKRIEQALELAADNIDKLMAIAKIQLKTSNDLLETTKSHEGRLLRLEKEAPTGPIRKEKLS